MNILLADGSRAGEERRGDLSPITFGTHLGAVHCFENYQGSTIVDMKTRGFLFFARRTWSAYSAATWFHQALIDLGLRAPRRIEI